MSVIKCKMCGGTIEFEQGATVGTCEYCGSKQTLPNADDEKKVNLFNRANRLRMACEFDKAAGIYEQIIAEFPEEAEAYWGLCLANYGIEYVDDPATANKIPTCHRASFDKMRKDENYELAIENADMAARLVYEEQAKEIDRIMGEILKVSRDEQPYDIFICYKETNSSGSRTPDSVLAQDIYDALTEKGYRAFFSRITLEDKLGTQYEPYIFSALNSAKMMLVVGTDYEYMNAVWVKNEWSRFIKLMAKDKTKVLIPCYRDMDPYDMPDEFKPYQSQDCGKLGFMQDLLRGIDKILGKTEQSKVVEKVVAQQGENNANIVPLLKRAFMFLEDGDWEKADDFCEQVLNQDPENVEAYLGKLMAELKVSEQENLKNCEEPFDKNKNYQKVLRFGDAALTDTLKGYVAYIKEHIENARLTKIYNRAVEAMNKADTENAYKSVADTFKSVRGFKDADELVEQCLKKAEECRVAEEQRRIAEEKAAEKRQRAFLAYRELIGKVKGVITSGRNYTIGLKADGTVVASKYIGFPIAYHGQCDVSEWKDIVEVSAGDCHTVGLKSNGTVVAVGKNDGDQCNVSGWMDIVAVSAGDCHTVGLKSNGTVIAVGKNYDGRCNVSEWKDIVAISAGYNHTTGLKSDGTVVAVGDNKHGECNVSDWTDIVAVSVGLSHTVGLKSNGTVVAVGENDYGQCNVSGWKDIVAVSAGYSHTVGLKSDGTVVAVGKNDGGQCNVSGWKDIVAVSAGGYHIVGLKSDGTVVAIGKNDDGQCNVSDWKLFNNIYSLEEERTDERKAAEERRKELMEKLKAEKANAENELADLHGLFAGKRRKELEAQIAEIDKKLRNLNKS